MKTLAEEMKEMELKNNLKFGETVTGIYNKHLEVTGTIHDMNENTVWIETEDDMYNIPLNTVSPLKVEPVEVEAKTELEIVDEKVIAWLEEQGLNYDDFGGWDCVEYIIHGEDRHNISFGIYEYEGKIIYSLSTTHIERYEREDSKPSFDPYKDPIGKSEANECERKTLRGVFNYITKYAIYA